MSVHLGDSGKLKIKMGNINYKLIIPSPLPTLNGNILLSSDYYILKDSNGVYLTTKEDE